MKCKIIITLTVFVFIACKTRFSIEEKRSLRPNILWIVVEDMSSHFGYQGNKCVKTPNVDRLAQEGIVYNNAYTSGPVCSASRSAIITGMYQTSIGAQNHRSSKGTLKIQLPENIKTIPEIFREAGYYTCNGTERIGQAGKEDYNFDYESKKLYNGVDWSGRAERQPFFAQIQLRGGKLRNVPKWQDEVNKGLDKSLLIKPEEVTVPPYYPDVNAFRQDWADYLNDVQYTDIEVGNILSRLEKDDLLKNTIIFFITDHGVSQARGKQFLYDEGTRIPFIVWAPKLFKNKSIDDLISNIDISATSLQLAGISIPSYLQSNSLLGSEYKSRDFVISARDRCDETVDHIRSVRKGNFKYIKNYLAERPYLQPNAYKDHKPWMRVLKDLDREGKLNKTQKLVTSKIRPVDELYDLSTDPFELTNLAFNGKYINKLNELKKILRDWIVDTGDKGDTPESEAMYDSNMEAYLNEMKRGKELDQVPIIEENIRIMKKWALEGK